MLERRLLLLCALALGTRPLGAAITVNSGVLVNANTCDQISWSDAAGRTRTASIVQLNGSGTAGKVGGYLTQFVYNDGASNVTCNESGYAVDGLLSGLGQMVNHGGTGNGYVSSNQDGLTTSASTQVLFQGANHVIYQVDMDENGDNGDASKGSWHDRWVYVFSTGHDYMVESLSYDFSNHSAGYWGYAGVSGQTAHDSRSPYCSFNWTGTGAANTLTESIDGIEYAARDPGTNSYLFKTVGSSPFSAGYTFNSPAANIPYTLQWKNSPDREIGYVSTLDLTQWAAGGGFTAQSQIGSSASSMPANWGVNYQANGFQSWMGDKMTWGLPYGAAGGNTGTTTFPDWTYARNWTGYPTMGYTLQIQLGKHSDDNVRKQAAEQASIHSLPGTALTAATGTVVSAGKMNLQDPTATFSFKPQGYNHLYHLWELVCASNAIDTTLALGAATLQKPTFRFDSFNAASLCQLTLNGVIQVEGTDIFTSLDSVNHQLYVTFNSAFSGNERIVIPGSCGPTTPTFTPTATATAPAGSSKLTCFSLDYSAVPALVNDRKITVKVSVGSCASVSVLVDGTPTSATYSPGTGLATFSTTGSSVVVSANGWTGGGTGAVTKALLYGDHHWAHSLTLDDGIQDQYDNAKPVLDARNLRAGIALNASGIQGGNPWNMTWAETQTLRANGWDVFNHSYTHPSITCANFVTEFQQNQALFLTQFPGYHVSHVVYPFEDSSASLCAGWPPSYILSAEGGGGLNYVDAAFPSNDRLYRNGLFGASASAWQSSAASAASNARPAWLITITHSVAPASGTPADAYSTNADTLAAYLDYVNSHYGPSGDASMWFAPSGEVFDYIQTRDNVAVNTLVCGTPTPTPTFCGACTSTFTSTATPTRTTTLTFSLTPTPTLTPLCSVLTLDDMEDNNTQNALGGYWFVYAGSSTISPSTFAMSAPGDSSGYCARAYGSAVSAAPPSLGTSLPTVDLSNHAGFNFWFKGDGGQYRFQIHSAVEGANYNDYQFDFTPPVGWSQVNIPWASLSFPGWGPAYSLDKTQISGLSWVPLTNGAFDFSVDQLILPCAAAPTSTPTSTPTRSATPSASPSVTPTFTDVPPGSTPTDTPTNSPSFTLTTSATPTRSAVAAAATATFTSTVTPTSSSTVTSATAAVSATPEGGRLEVLGLQAVPNPNPGVVAVHLAGRADRVTLRLYSVAESCVAVVESGPLPAGWSQVPLPLSWVASAPNGLYFAQAIAEQGSRRSLPSASAKCLWVR